MPSKEPVLRARDVARILGLGPHDMIELARKKKLVADQALDISILKEAARGNF